MMERMWTIIAGLCLIVAAVFLLLNNMTVTFVVATLGVVAWFLRLRTGIIAKALEAEKDHHPAGDQDED